MILYNKMSSFINIPGGYITPNGNVVMSNGDSGVVTPNGNVVIHNSYIPNINNSPQKSNFLKQLLKAKENNKN